MRTREQTDKCFNKQQIYKPNIMLENKFNVYHRNKIYNKLHPNVSIYVYMGKYCCLLSTTNIFVIIFLKKSYNDRYKMYTLQKKI